MNVPASGSDSLPRFLSWLFPATVVLLVLGVYSPGLFGGFVLDDEPNLNGLAMVSLSDWGSVAWFIRGDVSGPLGRAVSMSSFALQASAWPDPLPFKLVNLLIHGVNCILVAWVAGRLIPGSTVRPWLPWSVALLWGLLPIHVAGVLYVVQRMNLLAALFSLAACGCYLSARLTDSSSSSGGWRRWGLWLLAVLCFTLAVASKENALLLPLYLLVLEATLLPCLNLPTYSFTDNERRVFLAVVAVGIIAVALSWNSIRSIVLSLAAAYPERGYGPESQLASESRVLLQYLWNTVFPRPSNLGIFHDDFEVSQGWLAPPLGGVGAVLIVLVIILALYLRRKWRWFSFGVLWFFSGHALESSLLPLEPYFDHRNYLPTFGIVVALIGWLSSSLPKSRAPLLRGGFVSVLAIGVLALYWATITLSETLIWGSPVRQADVAVKEHPNSVRAWEYFGNMMASSRYYDEAERAFLKLQVMPKSGGVGDVKLLQLHCFHSTTSVQEPAALYARFSSLLPTVGTVNAISSLLAESNDCLSVGPQLRAMLDGLKQNTRVSPRIRYRLEALSNNSQISRSSP